MTPQDRDIAQRTLRHLSQQIELMSDLLVAYPETGMGELSSALNQAHRRAQERLALGYSVS